MKIRVALGVILLLGVLVYFIWPAKAAKKPDVYGPIKVMGADNLPMYFPGIKDKAIGLDAPMVQGKDLKGHKMVIGKGPEMVIFMAHWCPHCQAEMSVIVAQKTQIPIVGVITDSSPDRPNWPPTTWLRRSHWPFATLKDDKVSTAGGAYGANRYPYFVLIDENNKISYRTSGELKPDELMHLLTQKR